MTSTRIILTAFLATAAACAGQQTADTAPAPEPAAEPAAPAVDPAILEANEKDFEELNGILAQFEGAAKEANTGATEAQAAVSAFSELAKAKGIKEKNVDKTVANSLKANKVKLRGVKKADREEVKAAVQTILDKIGGLKATPQAIADARAKITALQENAQGIATRVRERSEPASDSGDERVTAHLDHITKVLEGVDGNVKAASGMLDDLAKNVEALAKSLDVTLDAVGAAGEAPADDAKKDAGKKDAGKADAATKK